jgi:hypothetical protein
MTHKKNLWLGIVAAFALAMTGCGDDDNSNGGSGGTAGMGGMGGGPATGSITAVHLAPEVPMADMTDVTIYVNGEASELVIGYGESTGRVDLPAGEEYAIGLGTADAELLTLDPFTMPEGADLVAVAYRTNDDLPVGVWVFDISTDDLADGSGRVFVGHGANDSALSTVNISLGGPTEDCSTLIPDFAFGTVFPAEGEDNLDLPEDDYPIGFDVADDECPEVGPANVPVTPGVTSILVAVDEDTTDGELSPQLWAIIDASDEPAALITE